MTRSVFNVLQSIERIAPARFAASFDRIGLQVGDLQAPVTRGVVSLDRSQACIAFAADNNAQLVVSHHPLLFDPISSVLEEGHVGQSVRQLIRHNLNFVAAHTNWDAAAGGINDALASTLGLADVRPFGHGEVISQSKLVVFVPIGSESSVIEAASNAGAGEIGLYRRCSFYSQGVGTFEPLVGSNPTIGAVAAATETPEVRIEMVMPTFRSQQVVEAIRAAHPYEEPAIDLYQLAGLVEQPFGRLGNLSADLDFTGFVKFVEDRLATKCLGWGAPEKKIRRVAVVGGAADSSWKEALEIGADVFVTGEVKQHVALEASEMGLAIVAAGHFATENPGCAALCDRLRLEEPQIDWLFFAPEPGRGGRPLA